MAKVSAHGAEIGTVYFTTLAKRYMSDGVILKNHGFGWKLAGKVKEGKTPREAFEAQKARQEDAMCRAPCLQAYRKALHSLTGLCNRWKLHAAVQLMPDDADGVWSEACDGYGDNVSADVEDCVELCRLYRAALEESEELKDPTNMLATA